jgi:hypothetical protein
MKPRFISLKAPGHINPMTTLAHQLHPRIHEVVFLYQSEAAGLRRIPGPENDQLLGGRREVSATQGDAALEFSLGVLMAQTEMILEPLSESDGTGKEAPTEQGHRKALFWLISLAALISFLVGILSLVEFVAPRTPDADLLNPAAEGTPSDVEVTIGEAIRALSVRH